jgi:hypothetical protein
MQITLGKFELESREENRRTTTGGSQPHSVSVYYIQATIITAIKNVRAKDMDIGFDSASIFEDDI